MSGSGKSTYAKKSKKEFEENNPNFFVAFSEIFSADEYFIRPDGVYDFNFRMLKNAHNWCKKNVELYINSGYHLIIIDNTNTRHWEYKAYLDLAEQYDYEVEIKIIGDFDKESVQKYAERNTHGVPVEKVIQMADRFEF